MITLSSRPWEAFSSLSLRMALGVSFLSAVADRFGSWGAYGQPNIAWGNYSRFVAYTGMLLWFLPASAIAACALMATALEVVFGLLLIAGWKTRTTATLSGFLLLLFGLSMTMSLGAKAAFNFSVFSVAGGAFVLSTLTDFPWSLDHAFGKIKTRFE